MAANTSPRFPAASRLQWNQTILTAANTAKDGTGTVTTVFNASPTDGSWVKSVVFQPGGTNVASVARIFVNNGGANSTAANNNLYGQLTLPAVTNSEVAAVFSPTYPMALWLPAGYTLFVTLGTAVVGGYWVTVVGADY